MLFSRTLPMRLSMRRHAYTSPVGSAVKAELVLAAAQRVHAGAHLVGEVEGVAHDAPLRAAGVQLFGQPPEIAMQDGVAAGDVEVRLPTHAVAEIVAAVQHVQHIVPAHRLARHARVLAEQIAVLAALIALGGRFAFSPFIWGDALVFCRCAVVGGGAAKPSARPPSGAQVIATRATAQQRKRARNRPHSAPVNKRDSARARRRAAARQRRPERSAAAPPAASLRKPSA